jgi:hypothetical protein
MRATVCFNFGAPDERRENIEFIDRQLMCPVIKYKGELFVLRAHVLGFIDNVSREGLDGNFYIQTSAYEGVKQIEDETA